MAKLATTQASVYHPKPQRSLLGGRRLPPLTIAAPAHLPHSSHLHLKFIFYSNITACSTKFCCLGETSNGPQHPGTNPDSADMKPSSKAVTND